MSSMSFRRAMFSALFVGAILPASIANADTLILQGSSTFARHLLTPERKDKIESQSGQVLTVIPNRSTLGIMGLIEGRAHMAMLSAPLKTELAALERAMPGLPIGELKAHEIARVRIAIVVNPANTV